MHETGHRYRLKYNSFVIVLFVRRITVSDYHFGIFKLFIYKHHHISN
jgi:hypothetical protein